MKRLYETITAENWGQGTFYDHPRACLLMHLVQRYGLEMGFHRRRVEAAIRTLYPERLRTQFSGIAAFNDHPETTVDDVTRVCKFAEA